MGNSSDFLPFERMRRVRQISVDHCGPAVLKMLFSFVGVKVLQRQIIEVLGMKRANLSEHGLGLKEMREAVRRISGEVRFWMKERATLGELSKVVNVYKYPVGVEWQGIFLPEDLEEEDEEGHFSVITRVDTANNLIAMVDPYYFNGKDRKLGVVEFEKRWWDTNMELDPAMGRREEKLDEQVMFVITRKDEVWPAEVGME